MGDEMQGKMVMTRREKEEKEKRKTGILEAQARKVRFAEQTDHKIKKNKTCA